MKKLVLAGASLLAVGLLILGSQTNVVGYQTIQTSQQNLLKERINQKELLFQTILDLANNKDIQRVILTSEMNSRGFFTPGIKNPIVNTPVLTKRQLEIAYHLGLLLSRSMGKTKMSSMIKQHQTLTTGIQQKINAVIENDAKLKGELNRLSSSNCNCGDEYTFQWHYPVICIILARVNVAFHTLWGIVYFLSYGSGHVFRILSFLADILHNIIYAIYSLQVFLNCTNPYTIQGA